VRTHRVAVIGIGNTDYGHDYRERTAKRTPAGMASQALMGALDDSGLSAKEVGGVVIGRGPYGAGWKGPDIGHGAGHDLYQLARQLVTADLLEIAETTGLEPSWDGGYGSLETAAAAVQAGQAETIALLYATAHRSDPLSYGGPAGAQMGRDAGRESYYYHQPWGFTAQAAHWALAFRRHQLLYGTTEEDLGAVAVAVREYATMNPDAVMRDVMTIEDYLEARYICRPLRIVDLCLVNDGAIAVILRKHDPAAELPHPAVLVAGAGYRAAHTDVGQLRPLVMDGMREQIGAATRECLAAAGMGLPDVNHFQVYDASSVLIPMALEGAGFCGVGEGVHFVQDGGIGRKGRLPTNTSGGMLSESYIHGYNFAVETVRQLRGEADNRQVPNASTSMYCRFTTTEAAVSLLVRADS
jgi:acetyl-CoA acetyltransferase